MVQDMPLQPIHKLELLVMVNHQDMVNLQWVDIRAMVNHQVMGNHQDMVSHQASL